MPKIAILDAGSQFWKLIDKKVRWCNVESEIFPIDARRDEIGDDVEAIIISGWPQSVTDEWSPRIDQSIINSELPILGICYGFQLLNHLAWGTANSLDIREDGPVRIRVTDKDSVLFQKTPEDQITLMAHGDSVTDETIWDGFYKTAGSVNGIVAAIEDPVNNRYATQFHPETDITEFGEQIITNFLQSANIEADYTPENREDIAIQYIQEKVWDKKVLCLVSGWVDSTVLARLLSKALNPEQLLLLHVDNGFMRQDESKAVVEEFEKIRMEVEVVLAWQQFLDAHTDIEWERVWPLKETVKPEHKRKIIGDTFMRVAEEKILQAIEEKWWDAGEIMIAQGTLRPDLIESASKLASGNADAIKTHHNDTELVRQARDDGRILEPLQDYHKDEVRSLWESLWLPTELVWRQPFPGPGLGIRILCAEEAFLDEHFSNTQHLFYKLTNISDTNRWDIAKLFPNWEIPEGVEERLIEMAGKYQARLLPIQSVGVQWDGRTYSYPLSLTWEQDWEDLHFLAGLIPKLSDKINRVVYTFWDDLETKDWTDQVEGITPTYLSEETSEKLRQADKIVNDILLEYDLVRELSQVPVILVPLPFGKEGNHSIVIRTFITNDFMTGVPAIPWKEMPLEALEKMKTQIEELPGISRVIYDLTSKPPGTTEWE